MQNIINTLSLPICVVQLLIFFQGSILMDIIIEKCFSNQARVFSSKRMIALSK